MDDGGEISGDECVGSVSVTMGPGERERAISQSTTPQKRHEKADCGETRNALSTVLPQSPLSPTWFPHQSTSPPSSLTLPVFSTHSRSYSLSGSSTVGPRSVRRAVREGRYA